MTDKMLAGKKRFDNFMKKAKAKGLSHKDAIIQWKLEKSKPPSKPVKSTSISKPRSSKPRKKASGFQRPKGIFDKISSTPSNRFRANMSTIKRSIR